MGKCECVSVFNSASKVTFTILQPNSCHFTPLLSHMANSDSLHSLTKNTSTDYYFIVEDVLWANGRSQPTSALPEISTIILLFTKERAGFTVCRVSLINWTTRQRGRETDCSDDTGLSYMYLCTYCSSLLTNTQTHKHERSYVKSHVPSFSAMT